MDNHFTYSADIWSLGLIILFILFGGHPYILNQYEMNKICRNKQERKEYFYKHKLLRKHYKRRNGKNYYYENYDGQIDKGQIFIYNYLIKLYYDSKISVE